MSDYPLIEQDLRAMCRHYNQLIPSIRNETALLPIKCQSIDKFFIRIHQSVEFWPVVIECLKQRSFPEEITDVIYQYVDTAAKNTFNPLMICTWQSDICSDTRSNLVGYPPCAIEFINGCDIHRDDVNSSNLSAREQISFEINTAFIDEVWQDQIIYPTLAQTEEWVTLFTALCYDDDGNYFIYAFFFATFSEFESNDHVIEFGWKVNVTHEKAVDSIRWMKGHNIEMNLLTGEVTLERFDSP